MGNFYKNYKYNLIKILFILIIILSYIYFSFQNDNYINIKKINRKMYINILQ